MCISILSDGLHWLNVWPCELGTCILNRVFRDVYCTRRYDQVSNGRAVNTRAERYLKALVSYSSVRLTYKYSTNYGLPSDVERRTSPATIQISGYTLKQLRNRATAVIFSITSCAFSCRKESQVCTSHEHHLEPAAGHRGNTPWDPCAL